MKVADLMTRDPQIIDPETTLQRAAELMDDLGVGLLPVCEDGRLIGVVTDRDITVRATAAGQRPGETKVAEVMTSDLRWCFEDEEVADAERLMRDAQIRRLPVLDQNRKIVGVLSLGDLAAKGARDVRETLDVISQPAQPDR
jgi:CBS domain-containing protein